MTASRWGWRRSDVVRTPTHVGDAEEYKGHNLRGIAGIFGEQLVWECRACGVERSSTQYIDEECPGDE